MLRWEKRVTGLGLGVPLHSRVKRHFRRGKEVDRPGELIHIHLPLYAVKHVQASHKHHHQSKQAQDWIHSSHTREVQVQQHTGTKPYYKSYTAKLYHKAIVQHTRVEARSSPLYFSAVLLTEGCTYPYDLVKSNKSYFVDSARQLSFANQPAKMSSDKRSVTTHLCPSWNREHGPSGFSLCSLLFACCCSL